MKKMFLPFLVLLPLAITSLSSCGEKQKVVTKYAINFIGKDCTAKGEGDDYGSTFYLEKEENTDLSFTISPYSEYYGINEDITFKVNGEDGTYSFTPNEDGTYNLSFKVSGNTSIFVNTTKYVKVSFVTNCETSLNPIFVKPGSVINEPEITYNRHYLRGWYLNSDFTGEPFDFSTKVFEDITLNARWYKGDINEPMTFTCLTDDCTISLNYHIGGASHSRGEKLNLTATKITQSGEEIESDPIDFNPSTDDETYTITFSSSPILNKGDKIVFKGDNSYWGYYYSNDYYDYLIFRGSGYFNVEGNVKSLLDKDDFATLDYIPMGCFFYLFDGYYGNGINLIDASHLVLSTPNSSEYCYECMFCGNDTLVSAPDAIVANQLNSEACAYMFYECENLIHAPSIIDTKTIGSEACYQMFYHCYRMIDAPELPATSVGYKGYYEMFDTCISLKTPPSVLPATSCGEESYEYMFYECESLTRTPKIMATPSGANNTFYCMFEFCYSLQYIDVNFNEFIDENATYDWVEDIDSSGTFVWNGTTDLNEINEKGWYGDHYIPNHWIVKNANDEPVDYQKEPLTFTFLDNNNATLNVYHSKDDPFGKAPTRNDPIKLHVQVNDESWKDVTIEPDSFGEVPLATDLNLGDIVRITGDNDYLNYCFYDELADDDYAFDGIRFDTSDSSYYAVSGNIMSLLDSTNFATLVTLPNFYGVFASLFEESYVRGAQNLILPATTLTPYCYCGMFYDTYLTVAPKLPATTLAPYCYASLFDRSSVTSSPELPATKMEDHCYYGMFDSADLYSYPLLPALELAPYCYKDMFYNCDYGNAWCADPNMLPATTLAPYCYEGMFASNDDLEDAPYLPATTLVEGCYKNMFASGDTYLTYLRVGFGEPGSDAWPTIGTEGWLNGAKNATSCVFEWNGSIDGPSARNENTVLDQWTIQNPLF